MQREVKLIFGIIATPIVIWILTTGFFMARAGTDRGLKIAPRGQLRVWTHLVGGMMRYGDAFPVDVVTITEQPTTWSSSAFTVQMDLPARSLFVKSPHFNQVATLKYDGWRWQGFVNTPGRTLPLKVEVW